MAKKKSAPGSQKRSEQKHSSTKLRMQDIASAAGVSKMTVSRALRDDEYVSVKTRAKVHAVIEKLGYVPDTMAANFANRRSGFVATLIPSIDNSNFANTVRGITDVLKEHDLQLLLGDTDYRTDNEESLIETFLKRRPEGIILTGGAHSERARSLLTLSGIPVIEMWDLPDAPINDCVGFSHTAAGRLMVSHLIDRGYRKLGFIGGATDRDTRGSARRNGFLAAIDEFGLPAGRIVTFGNPPITVEQGSRAIDQMLTQWPDVEAVFCVSDLSAFGVIMECHRKGLKVPDDLAVAGFGDFEIARACFPSITTITCDWRSLGSLAASQITSKLKSDYSLNTTANTSLMVDYSVVHRQST